MSTSSCPQFLTNGALAKIRTMCEQKIWLSSLVTLFTFGDGDLAIHKLDVWCEKCSMRQNSFYFAAWPISFILLCVESFTTYYVSAKTVINKL